MKKLIIFTCACMFFLNCKRPFGAEPVLEIWIDKTSTDSTAIIKGFSYPDTALPELRVATGIFGIEKRGIQFKELSFDKFFNGLPADTLNIFVLSIDTLLTYEWNRVREDYNILQRYDLSHEDLKKRSYVIEYPYDSTKGKLKVWKP